MVEDGQGEKRAREKGAFALLQVSAQATDANFISDDLGGEVIPKDGYAETGMV